MSKNKQATGQITLRCPVEVHAELLEIAGHLNIDLTALLNQMIQEVLPVFLDRSQKVVGEHARARTGLDQVTLDNHPLVRQMIEAGRQVNTKKRLGVIMELALKHRREGDPPAHVLIRHVQRVLRDEKEIREIQLACAQAIRELGLSEPGKRAVSEEEGGDNPERSKKS